jgi:hypothetical protein
MHWQWYLIGMVTLAFVAGVAGYYSRGELICIEIEA